jgi:hypothetical protein
MCILFAVAAIASLVKICICPGSDMAWAIPRGDAPRMRVPCTADQLSGNPPWHSTGIAGTTYVHIDRSCAE